MSTVVGIDVGGARKGFHAVVLRDGSYYSKFAAHDVQLVMNWCQKIGAQVIAVDAPCRWSLTGRARPAERALAAEGIYAFATPSRSIAESHKFYGWMLNGAELYRLIEQDYRLFDGTNAASGQVYCETFPHAVACALAGKVVPAKPKGIIRRKLLQEAGMDIAHLKNIDTVDAALCALAAHSLLGGRCKAYGDAQEGFIIVPALDLASNGSRYP